MNPLDLFMSTHTDVSNLVTLPHFILFLIGLAYIVINRRKLNNLPKEWFIYVPIILWLLSFVYFIMYKILLTDEANNTNYRYGWSFPIMIFLTYVVTEIIYKSKHKFVFVIIFSLLLVLTGRDVSTYNMYETYFFSADNLYKVDSAVIEIGNAIVNDENKNKITLAPSYVVNQIRHYADVQLLIGMDYTPLHAFKNWNEVKKIYRRYDECEDNDYEVIRFANEYDVQYIVWQKDGEDIYDKMNQFNYQELEKVGKYRIFVKR